jgi:formylglycine-generating enzyme required for sulfatase activity
VPSHCRAIAIVLLGALLLTACAGGEPTATPVPLPTGLTTPPAEAAPGDTRVRPSDSMVMVYVPGGTFPMGSSQEEIDAALEMCQRNSGSGKCLAVWFANESPQHLVTLDAFWIDRTELTKAQYHRCVESGHCDDVDCGPELNPKLLAQPLSNPR